MQPDKERDVIISELPTEESAHGPNYHPGSGYFNVPKANAWVCTIITGDGTKRVEIWPNEGGYLVVDASEMEGDLAPFHG